MLICLHCDVHSYSQTVLPFQSSVVSLSRKQYHLYYLQQAGGYGGRPQLCQFLASGQVQHKQQNRALVAHSGTVHSLQRSKAPEPSDRASNGHANIAGDGPDEYDGDQGDEEAAEKLVAHRKALVRQKAEGKPGEADGRQRASEGRSSSRKTLQSEETKRRIAARMRKIHQQTAHRRRISEALTGRRYVCSICGEEGHNKRGCPHAEENAQVSDTESEYEGDGSAATQKGRTKKMKGVPYSELVAQREVRRKERREEHKDRPKTIYKGLTWHVTKSGKESWHVQVWTGKTNKSVGYYDDEKEAAREYDKAVLELRGPDAQLNLPEEVVREPSSSQETIQLPGTAEEEVALAVQSIVAAYGAGARRQRIEYLLPLAADGEAGGVRQEFKVARNLVEATLVQLKDMPAFKGRISVEWLDKSDCVGAWQNEKLAAVVFCTADCLSQLRNLDGGDLGDRLMLVFNPQWQIGGQILSDFGFGQRRRDAEEFVNSFQDTFFMQQRRVMGDSIRIFKCYDSLWQVHYIWPNRKGQLLVSSEKEPPTYQRLLSLLQSVPGSQSSRSWVERVLAPEWLPGSSVPIDPDRLQSRPGPQARPGVAVVRGNDEAVTVHEDSPSASFQDLRDGLADMTSSPVTDPSNQNPVESPRTLAAAAAVDQGALATLGSEPPAQTSTSQRGSPDRSSKPEAEQRSASSRPERFGSGEYGRSFQMDPLNNMPQWQKQLLSNSFGRDRGDGDRVQAERKAARLQERKEKLAAEFSRRRKSAARSGNRD